MGLNVPNWVRNGVKALNEKIRKMLKNVEFFSNF